MRTTPFFLLAAGLLVSGCYNDDHDHFPPGNERIEVTHETLPFDRIELETSSRIRLIQTDHYRVVITGWAEDVEDTHVEVVNDRLLIEEHGQIDSDQVIEIHVPSIRRLESFGSSDVYGQTEFRQNGSIELASYGSGEIDMYVDADAVDTELYGSGDIVLEGLSDNLDIFNSGSGWCRAFGIHADFADVRASGSGSVEVRVQHDLDVVISGSGNVFYKGHPFIHAQVSGSGRLIDAN